MGQSPLAQTPGKQSAVRLDIRRLAQLVFYALFLPGGLAILFDIWFGLFPLLTFGAMIIVFPLAGFYILRGTLREMNSVIAQVAPEPEEEDSETSDESEPVPAVPDDPNPAAVGERAVHPGDAARRQQ